MPTILEYLDRQSKPFFLGAGLLCVALLGILDYLAGVEVSLGVLYLLPVSFVTWFAGQRVGAAISGASVIAWQLANWLAGQTVAKPFSLIWNAATTLAVLVLVVHLLSRLRGELEQARALSRTDFLTGVGNSRAFYEVAANEINRSRRHGHPFSVAYLDMDNFKDINDQFGHSVGDTVLRVAARTIADGVRATDTVARLGGDEFAILLPETDYEPAQEAIARVRVRLSEEMRRNQWLLTCSIGVATYRAPPQDVDEILRTADKLMYAAKSSGGNAVRHALHEGER